MVLVALWSSCSPRGGVTGTNPPGVKLDPPCLRPLATHSRLPGGTCSLFGVPSLTIVDFSLLQLRHCTPLHCPPLLPPIAPIDYHPALSEHAVVARTL